MSEPSTAGITREAFMARIAGALERHAVTLPPAAPTVDESIVRVTLRDADLVAVFAKNAAASGMSVHRVTSADAGDRLVALASSLGLRTIAAGSGPVLADMSARLAASGVAIIPRPTSPGFEGLYEVDAGLTEVQAAIAETGSLVCCSGPDRGRGLSLVPPVHLAIVHRSDIVADLIDYVAGLGVQGSDRLPSNIVLITGPSKTADIEGVLVTGVHGPREVHILLIDA